MSAPGVRYPDPPAHVAPYVAVLGLELTIEFLLTFGGAELYIAASPTDRSRLHRLVGKEKTVALARQAHLLQRRVPLAKPWLAACLHARGMPVAEIARTLRATDVTVRAWLRRTPGQGDR
jgi:hypothetical protein